MLVLAVAENEFDGQGVQEELPIVSLYLPAAHAVQICSSTRTDMSGPVYPTLHLHWSAASERGPFPAADTEIAPLFASQEAQFVVLSEVWESASQLFALFIPQPEHHQTPAKA
jgi:hypothetical protein